MKEHEITVWSWEDNCYLTFNTSDVCIDGCDINERDRLLLKSFYKKVGNKIAEKSHEPYFQHSEEDWIVGLFLAQDCLYEVLKEYIKED